jgi:hypothetical protein
MDYEVMIHWLNKRSLMPKITEVLKPVDIVLDIGCGIVPQEYLQAKVHICCEPFPKYIKYLQEKVRMRRDKLFILVKADWSNAVELFPKNSVDTVFLVDVIEHLEKSEALKLLQATDILACRQIAIFTPLGFMPQHHQSQTDAWGFDGGEWQEHRSGWLPDDFDSEWDIYASKVFHTHDSAGKLLNIPYGAMWAVKTKPGYSKTNRNSSEHKRGMLYSQTNRLIDKSPAFVVDQMYRILKMISKVIRF